MIRPKITVLASGDGSNFEAIVNASQGGALSGEVAGLLVNRDGCGALARAKRLGIQTAVLARATFASADEWNRAMLAQLEKWRTDWVVLAGFTGLIGSAILSKFPDRVVNSHPSLLPKFGGKGMFGDRVHAAVVAAKELETGVTIHLLNERFDEGPMVAQTRIQVLPGDTAQTLAERVKTAERIFYPTVLQDLLTRRIK